MQLSQQISSIFHSSTNKSIKFADFVKQINHKSFGVFLAILALPSSLPIAVPGYSTLTGIVLAFLGLQIVLNRKYVWFPKVIMEKELPSSNSKMIKGMIKFLKFFEKFLKPRLKLFSNKIFYRLTGVLIILCGISMFLPIPLGNTIPAFGIFLIGLGLIEEDGLFTLLGCLVSLIGILFTIFVVWIISKFGIEGVNLIKDWINNLV